MPIFEYYSPDSHKIYAFYARSGGVPEVPPLCPENPDFRMERQLSGFAVTGRAKEPAEGGAGEADDPRMEAAMAEMEREMAGMDEENPDPRQLGHLMRRMSEMTGESLPGPMEEMVRRLESGEDPEKLEEEFGDLDEMDAFGEGEAPDGDGLESPVKRLLRRRRNPARDPELYELRDYLRDPS